MKIKIILCYILLLTVFSCKYSQFQKPNINIFLTDDQGWGDLSIHGNTNISTTNIDNLAKNGVSFNRFYVSPVCSPTRAELLTGKYFSFIIFQIWIIYIFFKTISIKIKFMIKAR